MKKYHPPGFVGVIAIVHSPGSFAPAQKSSRLLLKRARQGLLLERQKGLHCRLA
jgi:hypothetical protein